MNPQKVLDDAKQILITGILEKSKDLFDNNPELHSFGWSQFTTKLGNDAVKRFTLYVTLLTPNINGNDGKYIQSTEVNNLQDKVAKAMQGFTLEGLLMAFGDNCDICIYKDLTYELTNL